MFAQVKPEGEKAKGRQGKPVLTRLNLDLVPELGFDLSKVEKKRQKRRYVKSVVTEVEKHTSTNSDHLYSKNIAKSAVKQLSKVVNVRFKQNLLSVRRM